ncbi:hypothetical protein V5F79_22305 [Xanthobacter flavus]|uniref:helix-turn-helix domain-containing protein n=1 Tax=Xanthobacter flavus TaxID=281 RepID=UPI0037262ED2
MLSPAVIIRRGKPVQTDPEAVVICLDRREVWRGRSFAHFSRTEFRLLHALLSARGAVVAWDELIDFIFADREDGGPERVRNAMQVWKCKVRSRLNHLGIGIECRWGVGLYATFCPVSALARAA